MSDPEKFIERWSRRKREAESEAKHADEESVKLDRAAPEHRETQDERSDSSPQTEEKESAFDLKSLPSLDSIGATSDIRPFLAAGVPEDLKRAALQRMWRADPAIRDFVGLSENSWDFNDPNGAEGFGPLEVTRQLKAAVEAMLEQGTKSAERKTDEEAEARPQASESADLPRLEPGAETNDQIFEKAPVPQADESRNIALQPEPKTEKISDRKAQRGHGGALPK